MYLRPGQAVGEMPDNAAAVPDDRPWPDRAIDAIRTVWARNAETERARQERLRGMTLRERLLDPEEMDRALGAILGMVGGGGGNILSFGRGLPNAARLQRA